LIGSTVLSAGGQIMQGNAAAKSAKFSAKQMDRNAIAAEAESQRAAIEERRKSDVLQSRARAVAAAGGGTTTGIGVQDVIADIENIGEYNALSALFEGSTQAQGLRTQADATRYEGKQAKRASRIGALSTVLSGGAKAYERTYG
jgi:hypothetical protein